VQRGSRSLRSAPPGYAQQMFILRSLAARLLLTRLFGGGRRDQRRRGRLGLFGPIPYYSTRTRRGTSVSVGGCCLPLALGMLAVPLGVGRALWARRS
jgi:hypothetical protein